MYGITGALLPPMLRVCTRTWMRDSHDLFDYETQQQVTLRQFATSCPLRLLRSDAHVSAISTDVAMDGEFDHLLTIISKRAGEYIVAPAEKIAGSNLYPQKLWTIVKSLPESRYALQENDIIKLGRFRLRVRQLMSRTFNGSEATPNDSAFVRLYDSNVPDVQVSPEELQTMQCRICLSEGGSNEDRLICACECKGSIKYIHVGCLQKWINSRWNIRDDEPLPPMIFIREVSCELCKARFPTTIKQNGETVQIVRFPKMTLPFVVLENVTPHAVRGVHLLSLNEVKDIKLGRGHESDVRIPDVSISRYHATIKYQDSKFYLEDHDSKFGTLVAMRRPLLITSSELVALQVGRSVVELSLDPSLPFVPGCVDLQSVEPQGINFNAGVSGAVNNGAVATHASPSCVTPSSPVGGNTNSVTTHEASNNNQGDYNAQIRNHILLQLRCVSREMLGNRIFYPQSGAGESQLLPLAAFDSPIAMNMQSLGHDLTPMSAGYMDLDSLPLYTWNPNTQNDAASPSLNDDDSTSTRKDNEAATSVVRNNYNI